MATFDCEVCCDTFAIGKKLCCPSCDYTVCISCQKRDLSLSHDCMSCRMTFTNKFLTSVLGKTFVSGPLRKYDENALLEREKALLPVTQPLVEWERLRRLEQDKSRFRKNTVLPPRPVIDPRGMIVKEGAVDTASIVFPCPNSACRGFIIQGKCGVCSDDVCVYCREVKIAGHVCNETLVNSINLINKECKSCPQCATMIFRTAGCDHMACQNCKSHFNWKTGELMRTSTNHHYDNVAAYAKNVATRGLVPGETSTETSTLCPNESEFAIYNDHIRRPLLEELVSDVELLNAIYDDPLVIRNTKRSMFDERNIVSKAINSLEKCRVQFMMDEIDETKWKSRIYTIDKQRERDMHIAQIMSMYLSTVREFQHYLSTTPSDSDAIKTQLLEFLKMVNISFTSIHEEYGGPNLYIREDLSNPDLPVLVM